MNSSADTFFWITRYVSWHDLCRECVRTFLCRFMCSWAHSWVCINITGNNCQTVLNLLPVQFSNNWILENESIVICEITLMENRFVHFNHFASLRISIDMLIAQWLIISSINLLSRTLHCWYWQPFRCRRHKIKRTLLSSYSELSFTTSNSSLALAM